MLEDFVESSDILSESGDISKPVEKIMAEYIPVYEETMVILMINGCDLFRCIFWIIGPLKDMARNSRPPIWFGLRAGGVGGYKKNLNGWICPIEPIMATQLPTASATPRKPATSFAALFTREQKELEPAYFFSSV